MLGFPSRPLTAQPLHVAIDEGTGPTVVLVHGIASSSKSWSHVVPLVSPLYRAVAVDLMGFGESVAPPTAAFTLEEHVAALRATIKARRIRGPISLVGHSLGSLVVARYAAIYRKEVAHVVLVSPPLYPEQQYIDGRADRAVVRSYLRFYRYLRENKSRTQRTVEWARRWVHGPSLSIDEKYWPAFSKSLENCIEMQTTITDIAQISAPVDVVYGSRDQLIPDSSIVRLGRLRHVSVHEVRRADHMVHQSMALEIARVLR